jgi:hypothetical protein
VTSSCACRRRRRVRMKRRRGNEGIFSQHKKRTRVFCTYCNTQVSSLSLFKLILKILASDANKIICRSKCRREPHCRRRRTGQCSRKSVVETRFDNYVNNVIETTTTTNSFYPLPYIIFIHPYIDVFIHSSIH